MAAIPCIELDCRVERRTQTCHRPRSLIGKAGYWSKELSQQFPHLPGHHFAKDLEVLHEQNHPAPQSWWRLGRRVTGRSKIPSPAGKRTNPPQGETPHPLPPRPKSSRKARVVVLDSGTTTDRQSHALSARFRNLTIITNAVKHRGPSCPAPPLDVILTGGHAAARTHFQLVGPIAEETLRHLNAEPAVSRGGWLRCPLRAKARPNLQESKVNRVMVEGRQAQGSRYVIRASFGPAQSVAHRPGFNLASGDHRPTASPSPI